MKVFGRKLTWLCALTVACFASTVSLAASFPGTGTGAIPDGASGTPPQFGTPHVITYAASGLTAPLTDVTVSITLTHTFVGDLEMILRAPDGTTSASVIGRVGVTTAGSFGDSSNYSGAYSFSDVGASATPFWTLALAGACADTCNVATGTYRATQSGGTGQTNPPPVVALTTAFAGLSTANVNGNWTLTIRDAAQIDTGSTTASSLSLTGGGPPPGNTQNIVDFDGNGRTDYVTVRNTGGGAGGQVTWFVKNNNAAGGNTQEWGIASDFFVPGNFDADTKTDFSVWRPGASGVAAWYILNSATNTVRIEQFGQTGDDPTVLGDYNNDGLDDIAVYRAGAAAGQPSFWYSRRAVNGPVFATQWGQNGDFPAPGDYDGDGSNDFVVQRNAGGGQARFWRLFATGSSDSLIHGTPTDVIVPGDYDGDGKTDVATIRGSAGSINWYVTASGPVAVSQATWGASATDFPTQGDYDGDGKTDFAIWRPSATAGASRFWAFGSNGGAVLGDAWGANGDYPVANYNSH